MEGKEARSQKTTVFEVEVKALHYMPALRINHSDLQVKHLNHMSISDCTISFSW